MLINISLREINVNIRNFIIQIIGNFNESMIPKFVQSFQKIDFNSRKPFFISSLYMLVGLYRLPFAMAFNFSFYYSYTKSINITLHCNSPYKSAQSHHHGFFLFYPVYRCCYLYYAIHSAKQCHIMYVMCYLYLATSLSKHIHVTKIISIGFTSKIIHENIQIVTSILI